MNPKAAKFRAIVPPIVEPVLFLLKAMASVVIICRKHNLDRHIPAAIAAIGGMWGPALLVVVLGKAGQGLLRIVAIFRVALSGLACENTRLFSVVCGCDLDIHHTVIHGQRGGREEATRLNLNLAYRHFDGSSATSSSLQPHRGCPTLP